MSASGGDSLTRRYHAVVGAKAYRLGDLLGESKGDFIRGIVTGAIGEWDLSESAYIQFHTKTTSNK